MIERFLLLPWIQERMIQVIERYKTKGEFLVFRSAGSLVSLIQVSKQLEPSPPQFMFPKYLIGY